VSDYPNIFIATAIGKIQTFPLTLAFTIQWIYFFRCTACSLRIETIQKILHSVNGAISLVDRLCGLAIIYHTAGSRYWFCLA
jgi:hypothetical protein